MIAFYFLLGILGSKISTAGPVEMNTPPTKGEALLMFNTLKSINREANYGGEPSCNYCPTLTDSHVPLPLPVHFDRQSPECQKWVEAHKVCGEDEYRAAKALLEITDYVSFEDFKVEFAKVLDEFNDLNRDNKQKFLIVIDKGKSTEWLARLAEPRLKIKNYKMVTRQALAAELRADPENKKIIVRMDDAVYTGNQMSDFIAVMPGQRDIYALFPYSTSAGLAKIKEANTGIRLHVLGGKNKIATIAERVNDKKILQTLNRMYSNSAGSHWIVDQMKTLSSTFFQHKVPDQVSAVSSLFKTGEIRCKNRGENHHFRDFTYRCIPAIVPPYKHHEPDIGKHHDLPNRDELVDQLKKSR